MKKLEDLKINIFKLNLLLDEDDNIDLEYLLEIGVYCSNCKGICSGIEKNYDIYLTPANDVRVEGKCIDCKNDVARILEFGDNKDFFDKAIELRKMLKE